MRIRGRALREWLPSPRNGRQYAQAIAAATALLAASACAFLLLAAAINFQDPDDLQRPVGRTSVLKISLPKPKPDRSRDRAGRDRPDVGIGRAVVDRSAPAASRYRIDLSR